MHLVENRALEFPNFCMKPSLWSRKKRTVSVFGENSKMAVFGQNLPKFDQKESGGLEIFSNISSKMFDFFSKIEKKNISDETNPKWLKI